MGVAEGKGVIEWSWSVPSMYHNAVRPALIWIAVGHVCDDEFTSGRVICPCTHI
eukprot:m.185501 g.185501  ORF g.185501 m.185501 type:complete len:54 (-) comp16462_c0_seq1:311-472(-)